MIRPDKYMDADTSTLNVSAFLLSQLLEKENLTITEAQSELEGKLGLLATHNLMPAISLLYLLGRLHYDGVSDSLILIKEAAL